MTAAHGSADRPGRGAGEDPLLVLLRRRYGQTWSIRRTAHLWIATALDPDCDHAPTLVQPDVETFVRELEEPPARACRPGRASLLSAGWFADNVERVGGDGACVDLRPPMT
ncbi:hypothetical protein ACFPZ0_15330 [Streptomonospora nanhaiensis]|uniref:Uncharacterized protein n=1 Tax=Streptomonospora nanhaiensis TaxID=1323731 RepID=A0A853BU55_9ACTN|nr:hypothetical protein [Streptomonospora nanhaiensis]MBV2362606.1 hypothetical protein [Streptomonospora nanhaiensis]MBX9386885.1 hypothetical protein [Streptomonospora nanhaiensis]NYI98047.1 hypothetical protein [Streptomonospora nanhaiensis]